MMMMMMMMPKEKKIEERRRPFSVFCVAHIFQLNLSYAHSFCLLFLLLDLRVIHHCYLSEYSSARQQL